MASDHAIIAIPPIKKICIILKKLVRILVLYITSIKDKKADGTKSRRRRRKNDNFKVTPCIDKILTLRFSENFYIVFPKLAN